MENTQTINQNDANEALAIGALFRAFHENFHALPLADEAKKEIQSAMRAVEAELGSDKPKRSMIRESLKTLHKILDGIASNAIAAKLLPMLADLGKSFGF